MEQKDTFLDSLIRATSTHNFRKDKSYLSVRTGHWLRISISMHLKRQTQLGHPWADTCWDFLNLVDKCFPETGIKADIIVSKERVTQARITKAMKDTQSITTSYWRGKDHFAEIIEEADGIVTMPNGTFKFLGDIEENEKNVDDFFKLPFGPVVIKIIDVEEVGDRIPWSTFLYWGWTFERGEEPMEVEAENGYSTVSGWKAYARWMQAYLLPPKSGGVHPSIQNLPQILIERKKTALPYLEFLSDNEENEVMREVYCKFKEIAIRSIELLNQLDSLYREQADHRDIRKAISKVYFNEQENSPLFKKIKNLHHDLVLQRR